MNKEDYVMELDIDNEIIWKFIGNYWRGVIVK